MKKLLFGLLVVGTFSLSAFAQTISQYNGDDILGTVLQENKCKDNTSRILSVVPLDGIKVHKDAWHFGVTPEGDIAIISNDNGKTMLEILMCEREDLNGSGTITGNFVLNSSPECLVSEITAGTVSLGSNLGVNYILSFAPIDIAGTDRSSSLCQRSEKASRLDDSRKTDENLLTIETLNGSENRVIKE